MIAMKKILINAALILTACLSSCTDVLDKRPLNNYVEEDIWTSSALAQDFLYQQYGMVKVLGHMDGADDFSDQQSDLSLTNWVSSRNKSDAGWTIANNFGWNKFGNIRSLNIAIRHLQNETYRAAITTAEADHLLGQAYLLKAAIYFQQARKFGGWIIVEDVLDEYGDDSSDSLAIAKLKLPRATMKQTYDYIIDNLLTAEHINLLKKDALIGQLNRGSAYALLSEVALHGGAYLKYYNEVSDATPYYEKAVWAVEQLDALGKYSLESSDNYHRMFDDYGYFANSSELILGVYRNSIYSQTRDEEFRRRYGKLSRSRLDESKMNYSFQEFTGYELDGYGSYYPDPRTVESNYYVIDEDGKARRWEESARFKNNFEIKTVESMDEKYYPTSVPGTRTKCVLKSGSAYNSVSTAMYENRDKRFYSDLVYDGGTYMQNTIYTRTGGNYYPGSYKNSNNRESGTTTGYAFKKFVPQNLTLGDGTPQVDMVVAVVFRLGRCYLNAAEAYLNMGNESKAREYINKTRTTHGGLPALTNEDGKELKRIYIDERGAELALENDRYWTLLRTGLSWGVQDDNGYPDSNQKAGLIKRFNGTKEVPYLLIEVAGDFKTESEFMKPNAYSYISTPYVSTDDVKVFTAWKRYLLPVPQSELELNENLFQNENWK